jgi:hypothetical protein
MLFSQKSGHLVLWSLKLARQNSDKSTNSPNQKSENLPKSPNQKSGNLSELLTVESVIETDLGSISCLVWKEIGENRFLIFVAAKDGRIKCYKVSLECLSNLVKLKSFMLQHKVLLELPRQSFS